MVPLTLLGLLAHKRDEDRIWPPPRPPAAPPRVGTGLAQPCQNGGHGGDHQGITLSEPGVAGSYELVERRDDGSLVLRPATERLSAVVAETDGAVFRDEDLIAHLERIGATEDDLPPDSAA